jgi:hypothetical protein
VEAVDPQFNHCSFTNFHHLLFNLLARFFQRLPQFWPDEFVRRLPTVEGKAWRSLFWGSYEKVQWLQGIVNDQVNSGCCFDCPDITTLATDDLSFDFVAFKVKYSNGILNGLFGGGALDGLNDDFPCFLVGPQFRVVNNFLLHGKRLGLCLLFKAFTNCFLASSALRPLLSPGGGYALPGVFQFSPFNIYNFNLAIEVLLDGFVFLDLLVNGGFLLVDGLLTLLDPVFRVDNLPVPVEYFLFVFCL